MTVVFEKNVSSSKRYFLMPKLIQGSNIFTVFGTLSLEGSHMKLLHGSYMELCEKITVLLLIDWLVLQC